MMDSYSMDFKAAIDVFDLRHLRQNYSDLICLLVFTVRDDSCKRSGWNMFPNQSSVGAYLLNDRRQKFGLHPDELLSTKKQDEGKLSICSAQNFIVHGGDQTIRFIYEYSIKAPKNPDCDFFSAWDEEKANTIKKTNYMSDWFVKPDINLDVLYDRDSNILVPLAEGRQLLFTVDWKEKRPKDFPVLEYAYLSCMRKCLIVEDMGYMNGCVRLAKEKWID